VPLSFVHVEDVVRAFLAAVGRAREGFTVCNVGDDQPTTWRELPAEMSVCLGTRPPVFLPPALGLLYASGSSFRASARGRAPAATRHVIRLITTPKALCNQGMKGKLGVELCYPGYRTGLADILPSPARHGGA
jgi:nucleoside-diphosphate-sugar epimerase